MTLLSKPAIPPSYLASVFHRVPLAENFRVEILHKINPAVYNYALASASKHACIRACMDVCTYGSVDVLVNMGAIRRLSHPVGMGFSSTGARARSRILGTEAL